MFIDIKTIQKKKYQEFITSCLKKARYIVVTTFENDFPALFGDAISFPSQIDYHSILFSEYEHIYCFGNQYHVAFSIFSRYDSIKEFLDLNNVYRLIFANSNEVMTECMYDGVIVY